MVQINYKLSISYSMRSGYLRIGLACFAFGLSIFVWSYFVYYRALVTSLQDDLTLQTQLQQQIIYLKQNTERAEQYKKALTVMQALEGRLTAKISQVEMVDEVNGLANRCGVNINASNFKVDKQNEDVVKSHQELVLTGKYSGLRKFFKGLNELSAITVPIEIIIQKNSDSGSNLTARIHLVSYQQVTMAHVAE